MLDVDQGLQSESMTKRGLKAGSTCCGFATVGDANLSLTVMVLPKVWADLSERSSVQVWEAGQKHCVVRLYENRSSTLRIVGTSTATHSKLELLNDLLKMVGKSEDRESAEDTATDDKNSSVCQGLVSWSQPQGGHEDSEKMSSEEDAQKYFGQLAGLLQLVQRTSPEGEIEKLAGRKMSRVLEPLMHRLFVDEVAQNIHWIRRGYVTAEDDLLVVRGRVDERSLGEHLAGGRPVLRCRFDEFTGNTPLLRTIVTALDVVCRGTWMDRVGPGVGVAKKGLDYRSFLGDLPSVSTGQALYWARTIVLGPAQRRWTRALKLARDVLAVEAISKQEHEEEERPQAWTVDTAELWERLLVKMLIRGGVERDDIESEETPNRFRVERAWEGVGDKGKLDILVKHGDSGGGLQGLIIDGKYSQLDEEKNSHTPTSAYQYQMYYYAMLTPGCLHVVLAYPRNCPEHETEVMSESHKINVPGDDGNPKTGNIDLRVLGVPFPSCSDVLGYDAWNDFLDKTGENLVGELKRQH